MTNTTLEIRPASPGEAEILSELAVRSKGYWGYSEEFLDACRSELTVDPKRMASDDYDCYVSTDGIAVLGFYAIEKQADNVFELEALFVEPEYIGRGVGHLLMQHAIRAVAAKGGHRLSIQGDPNASNFYTSHGANQTGFRESESIPGRQLPVFEIDCCET